MDSPFLCSNKGMPQKNCILETDQLKVMGYIYQLIFLKISISGSSFLYDLIILFRVHKT